ncbi:MAG: c-type cytochrome [Candidatus Acidiferrales bacterium]
MSASDRTTMYRCQSAAAILIVFLGFGFLAAGQEQPKANKPAPVMTPEIVGQEMFRSYCASCHGLDGKGKGPAAPALKKQPPDLTLLSKKYGGKFPRSTVSSVIEGTDFITDHGSRDMPIWGDAFRIANHDESMVKLKVQNLTIYIESIQQK